MFHHLPLKRRLQRTYLAMDVFLIIAILVFAFRP